MKIWRVLGTLVITAALVFCQQIESGYRAWTEVSAPGNPASGYFHFYFKTGVGLCYKNSAGTETCPTASAAPAWSAITNPTAALALTMDATETTIWTVSGNTGAAQMFVILDVTGNTGTGHLLDVHSVGTSTIKPFRFTAQGTANGVEMDTSGYVNAIGAGRNNASHLVLATDPANCTGNNFAIGIGTSGAADCAQPAFSNLSGIATPAQLSQTVNDQTGTTYTYVDGDRAKLVTHSNAGSIAGTLPDAAGAGFDSGWFMDVQNRGAGTLTITPTTSTIDGAASMALTTTQGVRIFSDGTNYFTMRGIGGSGTPGGSDTQIQYNSSGTFAGSADLTYVAGATDTVVIGSGTGDLHLKGGATPSTTEASVRGNSGNLSLNGGLIQTCVDVSGCLLQSATFAFFGGTSTPVDRISLAAPAAVATRASINLFNLALSSGSANGTAIGGNPAAFTGDFIRLQVGNANRFVLDNAGIITSATWQGVAVAPTYGGTGDDTSATTGVPRIASGNWTYDAGISHLATSTSADLAGVLSNETGTALAVFSASPTFTGTPLISEALALTGDISPAQITADQNDYAPTGFSTSTTLRLTSDASRNITGLAGGSDGLLIVVHNVGSNNIVLVDESASSTAGNRFALTGNVTLAADASIGLRYDSTTSRWRPLSLIPGAGGGITSLGGQTGATQTITRGAGIGGSSSGDDHAFTTASGEADFLASGALTCGAGTQGKAQVHTTPFQYCDNAATPALQYAAYGNSAGEATAVANSTVSLTADVTGILPGANGGTNNGFMDFTGPATSLKTYTLPNASATILTDNAAVTVAQGGSGAATLTGLLQGNGTSAFTAISNSSTAGQVLRVTGASTYAWGALDLADTDAVTGALPTSNLASAARIRTITLTVDGGGSAIATGQKGYTRVPYACTINKSTLLADQSGSIVLDVWKDTYANYPPTVADTITASAKPTLSSAVKAEDATLTGWTTSVSAGDTIGYNVDSAATVTRVHLILECQI